MVELFTGRVLIDVGLPKNGDIYQASSSAGARGSGIEVGETTWTNVPPGRKMGAHKLMVIAQYGPYIA